MGASLGPELTNQGIKGIILGLFRLDLYDYFLRTKNHRLYSAHIKWPFTLAMMLVLALLLHYLVLLVLS